MILHEKNQYLVGGGSLQKLSDTVRSWLSSSFTHRMYWWIYSTVKIPSIAGLCSQQVKTGLSRVDVWIRAKVPVSSRENSFFCLCPCAGDDAADVRLRPWRRGHGADAAGCRRWHQRRGQSALSALVIEPASEQRRMERHDIYLTGSNGWHAKGLKMKTDETKPGSSSVLCLISFQTHKKQRLCDSKSTKTNSNVSWLQCKPQNPDVSHLWFCPSSLWNQVLTHLFSASGFHSALKNLNHPFLF